MNRVTDMGKCHIYLYTNVYQYTNVFLLLESIQFLLFLTSIPLGESDLLLDSFSGVIRAALVLGSLLSLLLLLILLLLFTRRKFCDRNHI